MIAIEKKQENPIVWSSESPKVKLQAKEEYYRAKIECLQDMNMPVKLILLACWDAPLSRSNLSSKWGRKRFIKQAIKYYKGKLKEIQQEKRAYKIK